MTNGIPEERLSALGFDAEQVNALLLEVIGDRGEIARLYGEVRDFITMHATGDDAAEAGDLLRRMLILKGHYAEIVERHYT